MLLRSKKTIKHYNQTKWKSLNEICKAYVTKTIITFEYIDTSFLKTG